MTHAHRAWLAIQKEGRALLPTFIATAAAVSLGPLLGMPGAALALVAFCWGVVALGAHSIGHEYAYRTLPLLLGQPHRRGRMLAAKAVVLVPMVLALTLLAALSLPGDGLEPLLRAGVPRTLLVLAALCAVSIAPLLSMLGRGTLPGIVFTIAIPGVVLVAGEFAGTLQYGFRSPANVEHVKLSVLWFTLPAICGFAALASWWQFGRLQAIEGHRELHLPAWLLPQASSTPGTGRVRVQHPFWLLFRKELHLQQISFIVVGIYLVAWLALWALEHQAPEVPRLPLQPLTLLYLGILSVLIGSVASGEERQLGTLPGQQLLPVAAWKQWAIKAATALGLALLLGIALPCVLYAVIPPPDDRLPVRLRSEPVAVILLTTVSLYVSSLCGSGVRAMVASIPVVVGSALYVTTVGGILSDIAYRAVRDATVSESNRVRVLQMIAMQTRTQYAVILAAMVTMALLLRFGFTNHRSGEHPPAMVAIQATVLLLAVTFCLAVPVLAWR
jgi:hypothetical protein